MLKKFLRRTFEQARYLRNYAKFTLNAIDPQADAESTNNDMCEIIYFRLVRDYREQPIMVQALKYWSTC